MLRTLEEVPLVSFIAGRVNKFLVMLLSLDDDYGCAFQRFSHFFFCRATSCCVRLLEKNLLAFKWKVILKSNNIFFLVHRSNEHLLYHFSHHRQSLFCVVRSNEWVFDTYAQTHTHTHRQKLNGIWLGHIVTILWVGVYARVCVCVCRLPIVNEAAIILFKKFLLSALRSDKAFSTSTLTLV